MRYGRARHAGEETWTPADRGLCPCYRDDLQGETCRDVRRVWLFQLLRDEERRDGRRGDGSHASRRRREPPQDPRAARDEQGCMETVHRRGLQALPGRRVRLQVQHDGYPGGARDPPVAACRIKLEAATAEMAGRSTCIPATHPGAA